MHHSAALDQGLAKRDETRAAKWIRAALVAAIVIWPLINTVWGIDIADTGLHVFGFQNLFSMPEKVSFTTFLTALAGNLWLRVFGDLGIWGLNLFEVFIEWATIGLLYPILRRHIGKNRALAGLLLAIICAGTYFNVMNYHQFSMFVLALIIAPLYWAMVKDSLALSAVAGLALGMGIFARLPNVVNMALAVAVIFWAVVEKKGIGFVLKHWALEILGVVAGAVICVGILKLTGVWERMLYSVGYLGDLSQSDGSYNVVAMAVTFLRENLKAISFAGGWLLWTAVGAAALEAWAARPQNKADEPAHRRAMRYILSAFALAVSVLVLYIAYREVLRTITFPQMLATTYLLLGLQYVACFVVMCKAVFEKDAAKRPLALVAFIAILYPPLMTLGSNVGIKHSLMGMWLSFPILIHFAAEGIEAARKNAHKWLGRISAGDARIGGRMSAHALTASLLVLIVMTLHLGYVINNFDDYRRQNLRYTVDNPKLKGLYTTQAQADTMNGILSAIQTYQQQEDTLLMYGNFMLLHYLTDLPPYLDRPWITVSAYQGTQFVKDFEARNLSGAAQPLIVECMINTYGGFDMNNYYTQRVQMDTAEKRTGQWRAILDFTRTNRYITVYSDAYFTLRVPADRWMQVNQASTTQDKQAVLPGGRN